MLFLGVLRERGSPQGPANPPLYEALFMSSGTPYDNGDWSLFALPWILLLVGYSFFICNCPGLPRRGEVSQCEPIHPRFVNIIYFNGGRTDYGTNNHNWVVLEPPPSHEQPVHSCGGTGTIKTARCTWSSRVLTDQDTSLKRGIELTAWRPAR